MNVDERGFIHLLIVGEDFGHVLDVVLFRGVGDRGKEERVGGRDFGALGHGEPTNAEHCGHEDDKGENNGNKGSHGEGDEPPRRRGLYGIDTASARELAQDEGKDEDLKAENDAGLLVGHERGLIDRLSVLGEEDVDAVATFYFLEVFVHWWLDRAGRFLDDFLQGEALNRDAEDHDDIGDGDEDVASFSHGMGEG